jgi:GNAT superfamily N-acetyltransferase
MIFAAGNDPAQLLGAWMLWHRWCLEEQGRELDHAAFLREQAGKAASGCFLQVVAWDGPEPVAMVEMMVVYDAMRRVQVAHGDKAYVRPEYRRGGTFEAMLSFMVPLMDLMGIATWVAPVTVGREATAPWLTALYERFGFEQAGITMERRAA